MGEAKRRKETEIQFILSKVAEFAAVGQGIWDIEAYSARPDDIRAMIAGNRLGNVYAVRGYEAFVSTFAAIRNAPAKEPRLCLTCEAQFSVKNLPGAVLLLNPHGVRTPAIGQALCWSCFADGFTPELRDKVLKAVSHYCQLDDLRVLAVHPETGNA